MASNFPLMRGKAAPVSEAALQASICTYLNWVAPNLIVFAIPNSSRRTTSGRASNAVAGLRRGVFDLGVVIPPKHVGAHYGRVAFIEVKTARGRLSEYQQEFQDTLTRNRIPHCIARSIDDVREALKIWGVSTNEASLPKAGAWPS